MKKRITIIGYWAYDHIVIVSVCAILIGGGAAGVVYAVEGDGGGCTKVSADGTSSLHVSERAMKLLRENDWKATSDDGLVCE